MKKLACTIAAAIVLSGCGSSPEAVDRLSSEDTEARMFSVMVAERCITAGHIHPGIVPRDYLNDANALLRKRGDAQSVSAARTKYQDMPVDASMCRRIGMRMAQSYKTDTLYWY